MPEQRNGNDFKEPVKAAVAKRAGYCCSNCRRGTLRPTEGSPDAVGYVGEVAHIRGAMPGSARYDAAMTPEQRRDASNALFVCGICHKVVDDLKSVDFYTVEHLQALRSRHEQWVRDSFDQLGLERVTVVGGLHEAAGEGIVTAFRTTNTSLAFDPSFHSRATGRGIVTGTEIVTDIPGGSARTTFGHSTANQTVHHSNYASSTWRCPACGARRSEGLISITSVGGPITGGSGVFCRKCGTAMIRV